MLKNELRRLQGALLRRRAGGATGLMSALSDPRVYCVARWKQFVDHCFVPGVFYDIGANDPFSREGQQTVFRPLMRDTRFFLFEAMAKHEPALVRSGEPYAIAVLDAQDGIEKTFYETRAFAPGTGDSVYLEKTAAYAPDSVIETRHVTERLDSLVARLGWPLPDFIKLDTQGSELDILEGGPRCLAHARGVQIECNVQEYNEGAPMLADVIATMTAAGFVVYDLSQLHFTNRRELLQIDAIFVRADFLASRA